MLPVLAFHPYRRMFSRKADPGAVDSLEMVAEVLKKSHTKFYHALRKVFEPSANKVRLVAAVAGSAPASPLDVAAVAAVPLAVLACSCPCVCQSRCFQPAPALDVVVVELSLGRTSLHQRLGNSN